MSRSLLKQQQQINIRVQFLTDTQLRDADTLIRHLVNLCRQHKTNQDEIILRYQSFIHTHNFEDDLDEIIMKLHGLGFKPERVDGPHVLVPRFIRVAKPQ